MVNENGKDVLKRNTVFTERNFFVDQRQSMIDDYLSRRRLDRKVDEAGGYIGYYDVNGIRTYNPDLVSYFETSKKYRDSFINKKINGNVMPELDICIKDENGAIAKITQILSDNDIGIKNIEVVKSANIVLKV